MVNLYHIIFMLSVKTIKLNYINNNINMSLQTANKLGTTQRLGTASKVYLYNLANQSKSFRRIYRFHNYNEC